MGQWKVAVALGDLTLEAVQNPGGTATGLPQLLEVRVTDELDPQARTFPRRQEPSTAQVVLLMAEASEAAFISAATPVVIDFHRQAESTATPTSRFAGRASDPVIVPHDRGVLVTVTCTDYLPDLAQHTVGDANWPQEVTDARLQRMFDAVGITGPFLSAHTPGVQEWSTHAARTPSPVSLLALAQDTLGESVRTTFTTPNQKAMYELRPTLSVVGEFVGWIVVQLAENPVSSAPLRLVLQDGVWAVDPDQGTSDPIHLTGSKRIPADITSFDATWSRGVGEVNSLDVALADGTLYRRSAVLAGEAVVGSRLETTLVNAQEAKRLADYLIPKGAAVAAARWTADRFTVLLDVADENGPRVEDWWWPGELRDVRAVTRLDPRHDPEAQGWWVGVITSREWSCKDGECRVVVGMEPMAMEAGPSSIRISSLPPTLTYLNIDAGLSIQDMAHVHAT